MLSIFSHAPPISDALYKYTSCYSYKAISVQSSLCRARDAKIIKFQCLPLGTSCQAMQINISHPQMKCEWFYGSSE